MWTLHERGGKSCGNRPLPETTSAGAARFARCRPLQVHGFMVDLGFERRAPSNFQEKFGLQMPVEADQGAYYSGPSGLVACPQPGAIVAMKVLVEQDVVAPVRIGLKLLGTTIDRPSPLLVAAEDTLQAVGNLPAHFEQVHQLARTGGALDPKVIPVVVIELKQSANYQDIDGHPDRTPPVRVAAEHA